MGERVSRAKTYEPPWRDVTDDRVTKKCRLIRTKQNERDYQC